MMGGKREEKQKQKASLSYLGEDFLQKRKHFRNATEHWPL